MFYSHLVIFTFIVCGVLNQLGVITLTNEIASSWTLSGLFFTISYCFDIDNKLMKIGHYFFQILFFVFVFPILLFDPLMVQAFMDKIELNLNTILVWSIGFSMLSIQISKIEEKKRSKQIMERIISKVFEIIKKNENQED